MSAASKVLPVGEDFTSLRSEETPVHGTKLEPMATSNDSHSTDIKYVLSEDTDEVTSSDHLAPLRPSPHSDFSPPKLVVKSSACGFDKEGLLGQHTSPTQLKRAGSKFSMQSETKVEKRARKQARIERSGIPSQKHCIKDRVLYRVDRYISTRRGQTISLTAVGLALMLIGGCILKASQQGAVWGEVVWQSWRYLGDTGSHTILATPGLRTIGALMTLTGILYFSVIMGFVVDGIRDKMDSLKKGKSKVAEDQHTLMLGWTDKSIMIIRQICLANESEHGGVIVVLAETDKEELEAELASHLRPGELRGTQVVFRTGTPLLSVDLCKVAAHRARSIIIMASSSGDADRSDSAVLRTVLSLKTLPQLSGHIVAELRDIDNEPLVRLVGGDQVEVMVSHDVIGRLVLMAARSPGLAQVFTCLLGFEGNEFYFKEWPGCVGVKFGDLAERFPDAIPLGLKRKNGDVLIAPNFEMLVESGDQVMVLAEDDDTYTLCPPVAIDAGKGHGSQAKLRVRERILMCGWRRDIRDMIQLLDALVMPKTELHMVCEEPVALRNKILEESGLSVSSLKNIHLIHHFGNTAIRRHLEPLQLHTFTSLMILSDESRETDIMHSDSHTLASLLLIRDMQTRMGRRAGIDMDAEEYCKCICEVLDPRTQRTISTSETILRLSEFIRSNELVSSILAMISESRDVHIILDELLGADGASFEVEHFSRYCTASETLSFWQIAKRAMAMGEILCGFQPRSAVDDTVLNPPSKALPRSWLDVDFIVLRRIDTVPALPQHVPVPIQTDDFERTSQNRLVKSSFVRHQLLEAIVQEQEMINIDQANDDSRKLLSRAVRSFVENDQSESTSDLYGQPNSQSVRTLISVARQLADTLEKYEIERQSRRGTLGVTSEDDDGGVSPFDMNSL